jgi:hypothetical protein
MPQHIVVPVPFRVPAALLAQITSMSQEQIDALPEETRMQVLQVKQLLQAQGLV